MKQCPECGTQVADDTKFCPKCGCPIPSEPEEKENNSQYINCPKCGVQVPSDANFCPNCGYKFNQKGNIFNYIKNYLIVFLITVIFVLVVIIAANYNNNNEATNPSDDYTTAIRDSTEDEEPLPDYDNENQQTAIQNFTGEYRILDKDKSDYYRLFVNSDHTARIVIKYYRIYAIYDKNGEHKNYDATPYHRVTTIKEAKQVKESLDQSAADGSTVSGYPILGVKIVQEGSDTEAFSWEEYNEEHVGDYIELKGTGDLLTDTRYINNGRLYYTYNGMLAKDERGSLKIKKIK
jgi:RNA polymerase subunit RPABC4/transcription elongation factor Spt4